MSAADPLGAAHCAIITAGGSAARFGANKLLCDSGDGRPVLLRTLQVFAAELPPERIILVAAAANLEEYRRLCTAAGLAGVQLVTGGQDRAHSVLAGLERALELGADLALVHDGARPYVSAELIRRCAAAARTHGAAILARPLTDTIKQELPGGGIRSIPRETLAAAETPQAFPPGPLRAAIRAALAAGIVPTDEAMAAELAGLPYVLVRHGQDNRKITFPADLQAP